MKYFTHIQTFAIDSSYSVINIGVLSELPALRRVSVRAYLLKDFAFLAGLIDQLERLSLDTKSTGVIYGNDAGKNSNTDKAHGYYGYAVRVSGGYRDTKTFLDQANLRLFADLSQADREIIDLFTFRFTLSPCLL